VQLYPPDLVASFVINLATKERHQHTALAALKAQLGFALG
jgi:hypothetical protein